MKYFLFLGVLIWFLIAPLFVFAHGTKYLEFNPDNSSWLKVSDVVTPAQVFFAQSDFLGGIDLWVANSGLNGTATFDLLNDQGAVIRSQIITIPTIAETSNGTKFHIDFNSQTAVASDKKYSIRVTSTMPELLLYYSDRVQLVAHNAPFVSEYVAGVGKLGPEEQAFSFKYALYETVESSVPVVSNIVWTGISPTQMHLNFNANEPVDYKIEYGPASSVGGPSGQGYSQSTNFTGGYHFCTPGIAICSLNIIVVPATTYQYRLTVKDSWGNQNQTVGNFTSSQDLTPKSTSSPGVSAGTAVPSPTTTLTVTASPLLSPTPISLDNIPPVISSLKVVSTTDKSVNVAWSTDEAANSHLLISTPFFISITDTSDSTMELEHLLKINDGLSPNTPYVATVTSIDSDSNASRASISFITLPFVSAPKPAPDSINLPQANPVGQSSGSSTPSNDLVGQASSPQASPPSSKVITSSSGSGAGFIQWMTPVSGEPSGGYRIDIFDKTNDLKKTILVPSGSNSTDVSGLEDGEYSVIVYTDNDNVFEKIDKPAKLKVGDSFWRRLISFWPYFLVVFALIGFFVWFRKRQASQKTSRVVS